MNARTKRSLAISVMAAAMSTIVLAYLVGLPFQSRGNDLINSIASGYSISPNDPFPKSYFENALKLCADSDAYCRGYQRVLVSNLKFNYPIHSIFGLFIKPVPDFFRVVTFWIDAAVWFGLACAIILSLFLLSGLSTATIFIAGSLALFTVARYLLLPPPGPGMSNPFGRVLLGTVDPTLIGLAAFALIFWCLEGTLWLRDLRQRIAAIAWWHWLAFLIAVAVVEIFIVGAQANPIINSSFTIIAILAFAAAIMGCLASTDLPWWQGSIIVGLFLILINDQLFWNLWYPVARAQLFLIFWILLPLVISRPQSKWVWALFVLPIFHVSVAVLVAGSLFAAEAIVCIIRRRATMLLIASGILVCFGEIYRAVSLNGIFTLDSSKILNIPSLLLSDPTAIWGITNIALLLIAAILLLHCAKGRLDGSARVSLLLMILTAIAFAAKVLQRNGANILDPGVDALIYAPLYLAPPICTGGLVALFIDLAAARSISTTPRMPSSAIATVGAALLLIVFFRPPNDRQTWRDSLNVALGKVPLDAGLAVLSGTDDRYPLRDTGEPNDPLRYLAMLKYKVRTAQGVFVERNASIDLFSRDGSRHGVSVAP
jgi:hypothetical protein